MDKEGPAVPEAPQRLVQHVLAEVPPRVSRRLCSDRLEPQLAAPVETESGLNPWLASNVHHLWLPVHAFDEAVHIEDGLEELLLVVAAAAHRNASNRQRYFVSFFIQIQAP